MHRFHLHWAHKTGGVRPPPSLYMEMGSFPYMLNLLAAFPSVTWQSGWNGYNTYNIKGTARSADLTSPRKGTYQVCPDVSYLYGGNSPNL